LVVEQWRDQQQNGLAWKAQVSQVSVIPKTLTCSRSDKSSTRRSSGRTQLTNPSSPATEAETLKRRPIGAANGGGLLGTCNKLKLVVNVWGANPLDAASFFFNKRKQFRIKQEPDQPLHCLGWLA